ncbi:MULTISPECIES: outer membrane protein assembly factor BamB family protein [Halobacteriales]|uniref:outer membrane protein assembly factor BamB family protein n=1 Tax=Halobacteriales TaxID=2235 RepID=UPI000FE3FCB9
MSNQNNSVMGNRSVETSRRKMLLAATGVGVGSITSVIPTNAQTSGKNPVWEFETNDRVISSPTIASDTVFFGSHDTNLYAIDRVSGDKKWEFETDNVVSSSPTVSGNTVFLGSHDANLYAVDIEDGTELWRFEGDGPIISSPTVLDDRIFVGSSTKLYALDEQEGDLLWDFDTETNTSSPAVIENRSEKLSLQPESTNLITSSPTVADGAVYIKGGESKIYALSAEDGELLWVSEVRKTDQLSKKAPITKSKLTSRNDYLQKLTANKMSDIISSQASISFSSSPTVSDGKLFVGGFDKSLFALDTEDGSEQWIFDIDTDVPSQLLEFHKSAQQQRSRGSELSSPTAINGIVYITDEHGTIYAIDTRDGELLWLTELRSTASLSTESTIAEHTENKRDPVANRTKADKTSDPSKLQVGFSIISSPTVADGRVFVGSFNRLYALDSEDGSKKWFFESGNNVASSPTVVDGTVYFGSNDGDMYAIETEISGSSEGSRVLLETLGHHDSSTASTSSKNNINDVFGPGFSFGSTIAGFSGIAYLLKRRFSVKKST